MSSYSIYHNLLIKVPPQKVFEGVSLPVHLDNWWTLKSDGFPEMGTSYHLYFSDEYDWYAEVSKCEPNKSLHFKMVKSDADWDPTTFAFDLEEKENGTYLRFAHFGWKETNEHFKIASFCWAMLLNGLKNYLEKEVIVPFEERN